MKWRGGSFGGLGLLNPTPQTLHHTFNGVSVNSSLFSVPGRKAAGMADLVAAEVREEIRISGVGVEGLGPS